ncbi:MAG: alpha/beta hydrolase [Sarcina sp.]
MNLISHSNGFTTKNPKKKITIKFIFKIIAIAIFLILPIGFISNIIIGQKNQKKFVIENSYITIDGKKNYYNIDGSIGPTIIFESSSGMGISQWDKIRELLADELGIKSFAYERDGFGFSEFGQKKTIVEQAKELKLILRKVALPGPYIFVSEGYGSLVTSNFAKLYPDLVQGIISISPINEKELGNNNYYKYFSKETFVRKLNVLISTLGFSHFFDEYIGLNSLKGLENLLNESDYNNYKLLKNTTSFNKAYYTEIKNILLMESDSQMDKMYSDVPYVIITDSDNTEIQKELSILGDENKTKIINSDISSKFIALEKPELVLQGIDYIIKNISLKENLNP